MARSWIVGAVLLLVGHTASAGSFRGGAVWWRIADPVGAPNTVELTVTTIWASPTMDATAADLDLGDGTVATALTGTIIYSNITTFGEGYAVQQATVTHTYAGGAMYTIVLSGCCRHATTNNTDGTLPFKLSATVALGNGPRGSPPLLTLAPTLTDNGKPEFPIFTAFGEAQSPTAREASEAESGLAIPQLLDGFGNPQAPKVTAQPVNAFVEVDWDAMYPTGTSYELAFVVSDARGGSSAIDVIAEVTPEWGPHCMANVSEVGGPPGNAIANIGTITSQVTGLVATVAGLPPGAANGADATSWFVSWTPAQTDLGSYHVALVELASPTGGTVGECGFAVYVLPQIDECTGGTSDCAPRVSQCTDTPWGYRCTCNPFFTGDGRTCAPFCGSTGQPDCLNNLGSRSSLYCCGDPQSGGADCVCPTVGDGGGGGTTMPGSDGGCEVGGGAGLGPLFVLLWCRRNRTRRVEFKDKMCACKDKACADNVTDEMTKWSQEMAKNVDRGARVTEEDSKRDARAIAGARRVAVPVTPLAAPDHLISDHCHCRR